MRWITFLVSSFFLVQSLFASEIGASATFPLITADPDDLKGYRASLFWQPPDWIYGRCQIYLDGSIGHWWRTDATQYKSLNIVAIAPVFRYYFVETPHFSPFGQISVGLSYLSETHLGNYNLGIHFAFQDEVGLGVSFGEKKQFSVLLSALHYSNASLSAHNRGISLPLTLNLEYRF